MRGPYHRRDIFNVAVALVKDFFLPGIDAVGHIGGLLGGMVAAIAFGPRLVRPRGRSVLQNKPLLQTTLAMLCKRLKRSVGGIGHAFGGWINEVALFFAGALVGAFAVAGVIKR
jgi:hypothetical protein